MNEPNFWWRVLESNQVCHKATDLQSAAVTNAAHSPLPHLIALGCLTEITVLNLPYHVVHGLVCQSHYAPTYSSVTTVSTASKQLRFHRSCNIVSVCRRTSSNRTMLPTGIGNPIQLNLVLDRGVEPLFTG